MEKALKQKILAELQIDEAAYDEIVRDFLKSARVHVQELKIALETGDIEKARIILHTFKGTSANLRLSEVENIADTIRQHVKLLEIKEAKDKIPLFEERINAAEKTFQSQS